MIKRVGLPVVGGVLLAVLLLVGLKWQARVVQAVDRDGSAWLDRYRSPGATTRYVWEGGANAGDCSAPGSPCETIQYAVDQSDSGDEVRIAAGTYNQVLTATGGISQVVFIDKSMILWGGFTETNWSESDPENNPTILDAQFMGRVIYMTGSDAAVLTGLKIVNGWFDIPIENDRGGGIYIDDSNIVISQTIVEANYSQGGGGIYFHESTGSVYNSVISNNRAMFSGGGLYVVESTLTATGNTISFNYGGNKGGGINCQSSSCSLYSNSISFNETPDEGAGIHFNFVYDSVIIGNWIEGNDTSEKGGGSHLEHSHDVLIQANTFLNNEAFQSAPLEDTGEGGAIYVDPSSSALILENTFEGNLAAHGGGIHAHSWSGATLVSENIIYENTASEGCGGGIFAFKDVSIFNNLVFDNSAGFGGGICLDGSNNTVWDNQVITNYAEDHGGGIYDQGPNVVYANDLQSNIAGKRGGGAYISAGAGGGANSWWSNNVIARNQALIYGSGVFVFNSDTRFTHNTIAANRNGDGSGIFLQGVVLAAVWMTNTVIVSQTIGIHTNPNVGLHEAHLEATLWGADDWENGTDVVGFGQITTGTINLYGDPFFANPPGGDFHIGAGSPAIDAGIDAGVATDIDGESRPFGAGFDIGADEYTGEPTPTPTVTPSPTFTPIATPTPTPSATPGFDYRIHLPLVRRED